MISAKLPNLAVGYVIIAIAFVVGVAEGIINPNLVDQNTYPISTLIGLGSIIYWFVCIFKIHEALAELTTSSYPITPCAAVVRHFIPIYNLYWMFKWPADLATFLNTHLTRKVSTKSMGVFLLLALLLGKEGYGPIGLIVMFSVALHFSRRIWQVIQVRLSNNG